MKKICLILAVCLMLGAVSGCSTGAGTTQATVPQSPSTQPSTTASETTEPPTTEAPATLPTEPEVPKIIGYDLQVPEDFEVTTSEDDRTIYTSRVRNDASSILIRSQPLDERVLELDEQGFEQMQALEQEYEQLEVSRTQVDSWDALYADYVVVREEQQIHIYEYIVVGIEENYVFQFSDCTPEDDWQDAFADAAASINLLMENEGIELDYSHLEFYTLPCGIDLFAAEDMEPQNAPGFSACIGSRDAIILVMKDDKVANNLTEMTLADYAALVSKANELDPFTQDNYGNLHVNFYNSDSTGMRYFNYLTVKETQDSFWVFQMTCKANDQAEFDREFSLWATSIALQ